MGTRINYFLVFFLLAGAAFGQQNLIQNPSFTAAAGVGNPGPCPHNASQMEYWNQMPYWQLPRLDAWPFCWLNNVGTADIYSEVYLSPGHAVHMLNGEYPVGGLTQETVDGGLYYIEGYYTNQGIWAALIQDRPNQCGFAHLIWNSNHKWVYLEATGETVIGPTGTTWYKCARYFEANDAYDRILFGSNTIGGTGNNDGMTGVLDDVKLIYLGPGGICPDIRYVQNMTFDDPSPVLLKAADKILVGEDVTTSLPYGPVTIEAGADVTFRAGNQVYIDQNGGFHVEPGGTYHAFIAPCECVFPQAEAGPPEIEICNGESVQVGSSGVNYETYSWSSSPSNGLQYLSNPNVANPVFTPPSSGSGTFIYTLTVSNECSETSTDQVAITYVESSDENPYLTVNFGEGNPMPLSITTGSFAELIVYELYDASGNNLLASHTEYAYQDFTPGTLYETNFFMLLDRCNTYQIKIRSRNYCSQAWAEQTHTQQGITQPGVVIHLYDVITPGNDGYNDYIILEHDNGFNTYDLVVFTNWGLTGQQAIYSASGPVTNSPMAIWDGSGWNTSGPSSTQTVYYILELHRCNGSVEGLAGYWTAIGNGPGKMHSNPSIESSPEEEHIKQESEPLNLLGIYPNPNTGDFSVVGDGIEHIEVYSSIGGLINTYPIGENNFLKVSGLAQGVYFVRAFYVDGETITKRVIVH